MFGSNTKIIKVDHKNHGLNPGSFVALKNADSVGGFSSTSLNSQILPVIDAGIDFYTLAMPVVAGGTASGGGNDVIGLGQVKFEKA